MSKLTKMTIKVHALMWDSFDAQISRLPVKRNRFLNDVVRVETPRLERNPIRLKHSQPF